MKHDLPSLPSSTPANPTRVTVMQCRQNARIDPGPLACLYADLGPDGAEDTICKVLEDIANRLNTLHSLRCRCAFAQMPTPALRLAKVADQIGLVEVAIAADHVAKSASQGDPVALEATLSRLERGFDSSISHIWDVQHGA